MTKFLSLGLALALMAPIALATLNQAALIVAWSPKPACDGQSRKPRTTKVRGFSFALLKPQRASHPNGEYPHLMVNNVKRWRPLMDRINAFRAASNAVVVVIVFILIAPLALAALTQAAQHVA
jgi:hypothetical protein